MRRVVGLSVAAKITFESGKGMVNLVRIALYQTDGARISVGPSTL